MHRRSRIYKLSIYPCKWRSRDKANPAGLPIAMQVIVTVCDCSILILSQVFASSSIFDYVPKCRQNLNAQK